MTVWAEILDPQAIRVYGVDWTLDPSDTIATSTWTGFKDDGVTPTTALTIGTTQFTNTPAPKATVVLSWAAPVIGLVVIAVNHIVTVSGHAEDKQLIITCANE